jgi:hypothetical protein
MTNHSHKYFFFLRKVISFIFLFFVFFPFISPVKTNTDMQPYSLFFSLLLLPLFQFKITKFQLIILAIPIIAVLLLMFSSINYNTLRSLYNYFSIFFIYYVSYKILKHQLFDIQKVIKIFLYIWVAIGFFQTLFKKDFLTFLISNSRTTETRGVTSLAPEPTFFALILIFFLLFIFHLNYKNKNIYYFLIVCSILFFAKSSMGLLYLFFLFSYLFLTKLSFKFLAISFFSVFVFSFFIQFFYDSRIYGLISLFVENPSNLLLLDESVNDRFFQIFFSLKGFFSFFLLPHGFSNWSSYLVSEVPKYSGYVLVEYSTEDGRIMSGYGSLLFELGFFGLLMPFVLIKQNFILYKANFSSFFFVVLIINLLMISAIPIGFSYFGFYLALVEYILKRKQNNQSKLSQDIDI